MPMAAPSTSSIDQTTIALDSTISGLTFQAPQDPKPATTTSKGALKLMPDYSSDDLKDKETGSLKNV